MATSPPGAIVDWPGTSIVTPAVWACGATAALQVPKPLPASASVRSVDRRCAPVETSMRWN
jgi:hypothetical protein